jgi:uncharacterized protein with ACT and thioredoxin-like domain
LLALSAREDIGLVSSTPNGRSSFWAKRAVVIAASLVVVSVALGAITLAERLRLIREIDCWCRR